MLRTRLIFGLLPLLLLLVAMGGYAVFTCRELSRAIEVKLVSNYRGLLATEDMKEAAALMDRAAGQAMFGDLRAARAQFDAQRSRFLRNLHEQVMASAGTARAAAVAEVDAAFGAQAGADEELLRGISASLGHIDLPAAAACFRTLQSLTALAQFDHAALQADVARARQMTRLSVGLLLGAMGTAVLLSLYLSFRLSRSLLRPIKVLTASAVALGEGALDREVPVLSRDELGELARAFNAMAAKLRTFRDATTAKMMRARRTMEAALTSSPDPVFVVGRTGSIELTNPAADRLRGAADLGAGIPALLQEPLREVLASGNHYLPAGYDRVITLQVDGDPRFYLPRILAVGDSSEGFDGAAILLQDVTRFRLLDDAKNNLVGTVSHELKTPLTSLRMAVYLMLEQNVGKLSPAQAELLETARREADRLLGMLNDLLDLSRLEAGVSALDLAPVPAEELLGAVAAEIAPVAAAAGQRVTVAVVPGTGAARVDRGRIRHVFINLLTNASKYSPAGGEIRLEAGPASDGFVRFAVKDSGPGIPAEHLPHIFEKFYRVPGQTTPGAGLGLAIAREIVVAHGGSIACASAPGAGSEFHFLLPA